MFVICLNGYVFLVNICKNVLFFFKHSLTGKPDREVHFSPGVEQLCLVIVHCNIQSVSLTQGNSTKVISTFFETIFCSGQHSKPAGLRFKSTANSCVIEMCSPFLLEVIHTDYNLISHIVQCPKLASWLFMLDTCTSMTSRCWAKSWNLTSNVSSVRELTPLLQGEWLESAGRVRESGCV